MLENNFISNGTGSINLTLWDSHIDLVKEKVQQGITCFSFNNVRVKTFMGSVALTSLAKSQILPHAEPPMELQNVLPPEQPEADDTIVMNAEKILPVSNYTEYASCLNYGKKITELNVVDDIKCTICGSSQRVEDCQIKINVRIKLAVGEPWLTIFQSQWEPLWTNLRGSEAVTKTFLQVRNISLEVKRNTRIVQKILETSTYKVQDAGQEGEQTSCLSTPQLQAGDASNNPPTASVSTPQFPA